VTIRGIADWDAAGSVPNQPPGAAAGPIGRVAVMLHCALRLYVPDGTGEDEGSQPTLSHP